MPPKRPGHGHGGRPEGKQRRAATNASKRESPRTKTFAPAAGKGSGRKAASPLQLKKAKTKFHQDKFKRDRHDERTGRGGAGRGGRGGRGRGGAAADSASGGRGRGIAFAKSDRTTDVDIHLASKVAHDMRQDISLFKSRNNGNDTFDASLNEMFAFVPPTFVQQHLPDGVAAYKTYLSKFRRGAANDVAAFAQWYEWASFEVNKGKSFAGKKSGGAEGDHDEAGEVAATSASEEAPEKSERKMGRTREVMARTLKEREHVRALLQMCVRHNARRRKEGQHALINHLNAKLADADCRSLEKLRGTAHHSVAFALSRLILGMATEDLAMMVLNCQALYLVLVNTAITPAVVLSLLDEELALTARMTAARLRLDTKKRSSNGQQNDVDENADVEDIVDTDEINDPTKGERNQRLTAAVFALAAVVAATKNTAAKKCSSEDAVRVSTCLSFCYVQQKATRILSANALFLHVQAHPELLGSEEVMTWATFAFFYYPRMEYFRPEAIQFLLRLMVTEHQDEVAQSCLPSTVVQYMDADPLEPATLEQLVNALFRKEQVTMSHPMVHPVWNDLFALIVRRCAMGESLKEHLSTFVHSVIAPYRRGNADVPRRALFQNLVSRLGQIAVQSENSEERTELLHMASKSAGYGARTSAKPTPLAELRQLPVDALSAKVEDLLRQYRHTKDKDPAARTNRAWVLRELRNCLYVPVPSATVACPYVNTAVMALLQEGFYPPGSSTDDGSKNRCIFLFSDLFSFTYEASKTRPKATVAGLDVIRAYLEAEGKGKTRYTTAVTNKKFLKARNRIVEAVENASARSVLFYDFRDMEILLTLLFLVLSVDDPSNSEAVALATGVVPDLVQFCATGTLETLDLFLDVSMALIMRTSSPLQVMPLLTSARRIATGFVLKFAPYINSKFALDIVLSPLREAYHTDSRELARLRKMKETDASDDDDGDGDDEGEDDADALPGEEDEEEEDHANSEGDSAEEDEAGRAGSASSSSSAGGGEGSSTDSDDSEGDDGGDEDTATDVDEENTSEDASAGDASAGGDADVTDEDEGDALSIEDEEAPTQQFVEALKGMVGNADLEHMYPVDTSNKDKSDVVRAIRLAARVGVALASPVVVHVYQVLLAIARETVKSTDEVVFHAATSALEMLFLSKNRYYGGFLPATDLFQLLGDIQSYCRKLSKSLFAKESATTVRAAASARRRLETLKAIAVRVIHFLAMLAYKNHAGEEVRITIGEFYKSVFCDRGWDMKRLLPNVKKDLYHYRQGFAWTLLPAAFEKFGEVADVNGAQRVRVFTGCCTLLESMLSRISGLPAELKLSVGESIRGFLQSVSLEQVYGMKHTLPHTYLHAVKMVVQYNSRVHLDLDWVATEVVAKAIDDDHIQLSGASVRLLAALERMLQLTPRARETKPPVPVKVLFQQFEKAGAKEKAEFYRKNKRVRAKVVKALLAYRNDDPTDEERAAKRRRREELRVEDRLQRQVMRESATKTLTKEEREEKRKRIMAAKQERIAKNRERKRRLHEARQRSFDRWRQEKLALAASAAAEAVSEDDEA